MDIAWAGRCLEPHRGFGLGAVVGAVSRENALFRFGRVVDDHPQALPKTLERPDDVGLVQIVGEHVERDRGVRDYVVEERGD